MLRRVKIISIADTTCGGLETCIAYYYGCILCISLLLLFTLLSIMTKVVIVRNISVTDGQTDGQTDSL